MDDYTKHLHLLEKHLPYVSMQLTHRKFSRSLAGSYLFDIQSDERLLIVYGLNIHPCICAWLAQDISRFVLFVEDTLEAYNDFLYAESAEYLLKHPQIQWAYVDNPSSYEKLGQQIAQKFLLASTAYIASPHKSQELFLHLKHVLKYTIEDYNSCAAQQLGNSIIGNIHKNMKTLFPAYDAGSLKGCLKGLPAVVCGAGPSFLQLKEKRSNACIFACGAAINLLGSISHLNVVIDPSELEAEYLYYQNTFTTPYCLRARVHPEAVAAIQGPRILFPGVPGFPLSLFLDRSLGFQGEELPGGVSATTFGLRIALFMGCDPIFLCGIDLCRKGSMKYSGFVSPNAEQKSVSIEGTDRLGQNVQTSATWLVESQCLSNIARQHPNNTIINCSEGLPIQNIPFGAIKEYNPTDVSNRIHACLQSCQQVQPSRNEIDEVLHTIHSSLSRCRGLLIDIQEHSPDTLAYEALLEEEIAYQTILKNPSTIYGDLWEQNIQLYFNSWEKKLSTTMYLEEYVDALCTDGKLYVCD